MDGGEWVASCSDSSPSRLVSPGGEVTKIGNLWEREWLRSGASKTLMVVEAFTAGNRSSKKPRRQAEKSLSNPGGGQRRERIVSNGETQEHRWTRAKPHKRAGNTKANRWRREWAAQGREKTCSTEQHTRDREGDSTITKKRETRNHQPDPSTWSPTKPEEPFMTSGDRRRIARAVSW